MCLCIKERINQKEQLFSIEKTLTSIVKSWQFMRNRHKILLKSYLIDCHTVKTSKQILMSPLKVMGLDDKIKPYKHL